MIQIDTALLSGLSAEVNLKAKDESQAIDFNQLINDTDLLNINLSDTHGLMPMILSGQQQRLVTNEDGKILPLGAFLGENFPPDIAEKLNALFEHLPERMAKPLIASMTHAPSSKGEFIKPEQLLSMLENSAELDTVPEKAEILKNIQSVLENSNTEKNNVKLSIKELMSDENISEVEFSAINQKTLNQILSASHEAPVKSTPLNLLADHDLNTLVQTERTLNNSSVSTASKFQVTLPIQHENWSHAFNSQLLIMVKNQTHTAQLNIHPAELGPVEIHISMNQDQTNIQFISQHGVVREVIEDAMPRLKTMMAEVGVELGDVQVSNNQAEQQHAERQAQQDATESERATDRLLTEHTDTEIEQEQLAIAKNMNLIDHYI